MLICRSYEVLQKHIKKLKSFISVKESQCTLHMEFHWVVTFNDSKCSVLSIRGKNFSASYIMYVIDSKPFMSVDFQKDLGIILTSDLSWNKPFWSHISKSIQKSWFDQGIFGGNKQVSVRKGLYLTLVTLQLGSSSVIWRPRFHQRPYCT